MAAGLFVTATDTGVGKTAVSAGLLNALRRRGISVGALKPAETGFSGGPGDWPPDGFALARSAGLIGEVPRGQVVPYVLPEPLAPSVAAERAGVEIELTALDAAFDALVRSRQFVLVEGAGGLAVPLTRGVTMAGLAARWQLPLLVVARAGLGTINHTVLTVAYARQQGLDVLGIVINRYPRNPQPDAETSPAVIEAMTGVPVLGRVPEHPEVDVEAGRLEQMADLVEKSLDLGPILERIERSFGPGE